MSTDTETSDVPKTPTMREALEAVLLFHGLGGYWDESRDRWIAVTGAVEANSRCHTLRDAVRVALENDADTRVSHDVFVALESDGSPKLDTVRSSASRTAHSLFFSAGSPIAAARLTIMERRYRMEPVEYVPIDDAQQEQSP